MINKLEYIDRELINLEKNNLIRNLNTFKSTQSVKSIVNNREVLLFSSSNYLSLMNNEDILNKAFQDTKIFGLGSGGSRLTTGNSILHERLENKIADFLSYESSVVFSSGYCANVGVISSLADKDTVIFSDSKNHASIIDGCKLSRASIVVYDHLNMSDLEEKLKKYEDNRKIIISDGVFSMDGDILNLAEFASLGNKYNALTIVDDAHGFGVLGEKGRGIVEYFNNEYFPDILIGTLSKAMASEGGFAASSLNIKRFLQNKARSFIFSTSLSPFVVSSSYYILDYLEKNNASVKKLQFNINYFIKELNKIGINIENQSSIIKIIIGDEKKAMKVSEEFLKRGIYIPAIRFPAVEKNKAILRITLMSEHNIIDLDRVIDLLILLREIYNF